MEHVPVLAGAALEYLRVREEGVYVDCTAGAGGHASLIAQQLGPSGRLIAIDRDPVAVALATDRLAPYRQAEVHRGNLGALGAILGELGIERVDGVLIDAGVSSMQLDRAERGFSFQEEGPLDMRMGPDAKSTAAEYLSQVEESELARVLREYGDLKKAKRIAAAICRRRDAGTLETTKDLADTVGEVFDFVQGTPMETRRVFQSIRIAINDELGALKAGLEQGIDALAPEGRIVSISFHSGEDRVVKNVLRSGSQAHNELYPDGRVKEVHAARLRLLTSKPILPSEDEIDQNPRAQSAKLRAAERIA